MSRSVLQIDLLQGDLVENILNRILHDLFMVIVIVIIIRANA